jgi:hypothetical protein
VNAVGLVGDTFERGVVKHDRHVVRRQLDVELHVLQAEIHGGLERLQRVFRELGRVAAMRDDFGEVLNGHAGVVREPVQDIT